MGTLSRVTTEDRTASLSGAATLLLVAIDPESGRLVARHRRRFRRALAKAHGAHGPLAATRAMRAAAGELRDAGLIEGASIPGRFPIVPGAGAGRALGRIRRAMDGHDDPEGEDLFVVLSWTGVLTARLTRSERQRAWTRMRALLETPPEAPAPTRLAGGGSTVSDLGLGVIALHSFACSLLIDHHHALQEQGVHGALGHAFGHASDAGGHHYGTAGGHHGGGDGGGGAGAHGGHHG